MSINSNTDTQQSFSSSNSQQPSSSPSTDATPFTPLPYTTNPYSYAMFPHATGKQQTILHPMESCIVKSCVSGVMGGGLGLLMGIVFTSMGSDPFMQDARVRDMSTRDQIKYSYRQTVTRSKSLGKQFGFIGGMYSLIECVIEKKRASHDIYNPLMAGCITGSLLAIKGGVQATLVGGIGFMLFSLAIEKWQERDAV